MNLDSDDTLSQTMAYITAVAVPVPVGKQSCHNLPSSMVWLSITCELGHSSAWPELKVSNMQGLRCSLFHLQRGWRT